MVAWRDHAGEAADVTLSLHDPESGLYDQPGEGASPGGGAVNDIQTALGPLRDRMERMRGQRAELTAWIDSLLDMLQGTISHRPLTLEEAWELYWFDSDIKASSIAAGLTLGGIPAAGSSLYLIVGPGPIAAVCGVCGDGVRRTSRSDEKHGQDICLDCREQRHIVLRQQWHDRESRYRQYVEMLRALPYPEYLKTDHWQALRRAALKRAKYACQVCNTDDEQLDVHHRTYERRGEELASDLIVLCHTCHGRHHGIPGVD